MPKRRKEKFKITSEDFLKMDRAARRQQRLEQGEYRPTTVHKTSKLDELERESNTVKDAEYIVEDEILSTLDASDFPDLVDLDQEEIWENYD